MVQDETGRQYYMDWLRVGAMFLIIFFHSGCIFSSDPWHIKNAVSSPAITVFTHFLDIWQMPLFFILAGASLWFSLGRRSPGQFLNERVLRLIVPLIFGMLVLVPPQVYYQRLFYKEFSGSFLAWYPNTFHGTYSATDPSAGNLSWHHLWFLAYLFVFSFLLLPVFWYLRKNVDRAWISRITGFLARSGAIFLPAIPLIVINIALRPIYGWGNHNLITDWANLMFYITVFFCGFLLVMDERLLQAVRRDRHIMLAVAIVMSMAAWLLSSGVFLLPEPIWLAFWAMASWCWLMAFFGIGSLSFNFTNRILAYASDAVLPVYIIHHLFIIVLGYYVIPWNTGIAVKFFFIGFATMFGSLAVYEVIRRNNVTRSLFGLKIKRK